MKLLISHAPRVNPPRWPVLVLLFAALGELQGVSAYDFSGCCGSKLKHWFDFSDSSASFRSPEVIRFSLMFTLVLISQSSVAHALTPYADFKQRSAFDGFPASNTISLSIDGDTIVSGAQSDNNKGAAYVFMRDIPGDLSSSWTQVAKLTAGDGAAMAQFGLIVSIYSNTIVSGAYGDGSNKGAAYVFTRDTPGQLGSSWTQQAKLTASVRVGGAQFGHSVSIYGDTIVIGASRDDSKGAVYVFTRDTPGDLSSVWTQHAKLTASDDGVTNAQFGISLSLKIDTIVIGASTHQGIGSAYIFTRDTAGDLASSWEQRAVLAANDSTFGMFGYSVSMDGDTVLIGAAGAWNQNVNGAAYVFTRNTPTDLSSGWTYRTRLTANDGKVDDRFGSSVSIDGDTVAIGAWATDDNGPTTGSVYIFTRGTSGDVTSNYTQLFKFSSNDIQNYDSFGEGVLIDKYTLVVGAFWNGGSLYMFSPDPCTASTDQSKDGSSGAFYCINGGTTGGITGSCTCTGCNTGYDGASCETAGSCSASDDPEKDGSDGKFWCINGGIVGGTTTACTCTCQVGWGGLSCQTASACTASDDRAKDGSDGVLYCAEVQAGAGAGTIGGTTGDCTCTCQSGYGGSGCETAGACSASTDSSNDGTDGSIYCINTGGIAGGTAGTCTCQPGHEGNGCDTASACTASSDSSKDGTDGTLHCPTQYGTIAGTTGNCTCTCKDGYGGSGCETAGACSASSNSTKDGSDGIFYCINGGTISGAAGSCTCTCTSGYKGLSCETAINCATEQYLDGVECSACSTYSSSTGGTATSCTCAANTYASKSGNSWTCANCTDGGTKAAGSVVPGTGAGENDEDVCLAPLPPPPSSPPPPGPPGPPGPNLIQDDDDGAV